MPHQRRGCLNVLSLVLTYWDRQEAANQALALLAKHYHALPIEVVVVDDGSPTPFKHIGFPGTAMTLKVVRLPAKTACQSPTTPFNLGVQAAHYDVIGLGGVEMLHRSPVLAQMRDELLQGDKSYYVSAAVWCPDQNRWHVHNSLNRPPLNFMTMLNRDLYERAGGFDDDYREGFAFEDNDFLNRLFKVGMHYCIRDDLVVEHQRKGAKGRYSSAQHERNRLLYLSKWKQAA